MTDHKETIGEYLKRERESRQISLKEISEATKISVARLRLIEENRFDELPAEVFVKGFIKNYAEYVGLDMNEVMMKLAEQFQDSLHAASQQEVPKGEFDLEQKSNWFMIVLIILLLAVLAGLGYYFFLKPSVSGSGVSKSIQNLNVVPETQEDKRLNQDSNKHPSISLTENQKITTKKSEKTNPSPP